MEHASPQLTEKRIASFWVRHRFFFLVFITILISLSMTVISLVMYNVSGSAQLDLSRPGYQSVSSQVEREDTTGDFSASGPVTQETINDFIKTFNQYGDRAKAVDAFNGDPLNPETLEFTESTPSQITE